MSFEVKIKHTIENKNLNDLVASGLNGGISYWCEAVSRFRPLDYSAGFTLLAQDPESGAYVEVTITTEMLQNALQQMANEYPDFFKDFTNDMYDAETGDIFLQLAAFGRLIYG